MSVLGRSASRLVGFTLLVGLSIGCLLWLPAAWLSPLLPARLSCADLRGSVWSGRCVGLSVDGSRSGTVSWAISWPRFKSLTAPDLKLPLHLDWSSADSNARVTLLLAGDLGERPWPEIETADLDVSLQTVRNALPANVRLGPVTGVDGRLAARGLKLPSDLDGTLRPFGALRISNARLLRGDVSLGNFWVEFPRTTAASPHGAVRDLGGPLRVAGEIAFASAGAYSAVLRVEARSASAAHALGITGPFELKLEGRL